MSKTKTDRESRKFSKWKFAKELECLDMFLHYKCVKMFQGVQKHKVKGSGANSVVYDVPVQPGQWFTSYSELTKRLPLNEPITENRIKTLLDTLSNENCTKFNIQDVLNYSKGCTKINVQGIPNLGIMISLADITDEALFKQLEKDPKYVQKLIFGCTKNDVRNVQKSICNNNTNNINTNINTKVNYCCTFGEHLLTQLFGQNYYKSFCNKDDFEKGRDWLYYNSLTNEDKVFIYNISIKFIGSYNVNLCSFKYTDFLELIDYYKEYNDVNIIISSIRSSLNKITHMASVGDLDYIYNIKEWVRSSIRNSLYHPDHNVLLDNEELEELPF